MNRYMKKTLTGIMMLTLSIGAAQAQSKNKTSPTKNATQVIVSPKPNNWIFTFGKDTVYQQEFERLLTKNRKEKDIPTDPEIREYLELYQNFKMKVSEARKLQLDTFPAFLNELAGYRKQLANPYLTDKKVSEVLLKEAYERTLIEVNASHILINCAENASIKDTLEAYNKIMDLRKRIMKGESFDSVASKNSEDPSAIRNFGNLGWFTAFYMIYPFETMAYNTPKGQVSMPFRTRFGYHILKVNDRRPTRGEVQVAHIMLQTPPNAGEELIAEKKKDAEEIYNKLMNGENFEGLAKAFSDDMGSKNNGGVMSFMSSLSNFPEDFKDVAFATPKGETTRPFRTDYGWHIIKVLEIKGAPSMAESEENLRNKIMRDSRSESNRLAVSERIKKETRYKDYPAVLKSFIDALDESFMQGDWEPNYEKIPQGTIVSFNDKNFDTRDFANFLRTTMEPRPGESKEMLVNTMYKRYTNEKALEYEEGILEDKYEEFRFLMQEYRDGIMLFDLTDKMVWTKAVTDTVGLEAFHAANKNKYMWKERLNVYTVTSIDAKSKANAMKMARAGKNYEEIIAKLNKKIKGAVFFELNKFEKGANPQMDKLWNTKGVVDIPNENNTFRFYIVEGVGTPEPKSLKEARGMITSDYQTVLEKRWIEDLRIKYPVVVNEDAIKQLFR
jgi:peptidyl-prolyl cis-trans isomerase SurA